MPPSFSNEDIGDDTVINIPNCTLLSENQIPVGNIHLTYTFSGFPGISKINGTKFNSESLSSHQLILHFPAESSVQ